MFRSGHRGKAAGREGTRACTLSRRGGRDVVRQFAHMHNVRVWQLQNRAKPFAEGLSTFATKLRPDRDTLKAALVASADRIAEYAAEAAAGRARTLMKGIAVHVAYFIAHESHHRGSILLTLKTCGHMVDQATRYAIWDWDRM